MGGRRADVGVVAVLTLFLPMSLPGLVFGLVFGAVAVIFGIVGAIRRGGTAVAVIGLLLGLLSVGVALAFG